MDVEVTRRYVLAQLAARGLGQRDLAKQAGLTYAQLNNVLSGYRAHTGTGREVQRKVAECFGFHSWEALECEAQQFLHDINPGAPINRVARPVMAAVQEVSA